MGNTPFLRILRGCLDNVDIDRINEFQPIRKGKINLTTGEILFEDGMRDFQELKTHSNSFIPTEDNTMFQHTTR